MEIVTTIVENIVGLIFAPVRQEIGYPFSYKSNVDKLRAEVQKLTDDWNDKQHIVAEAKRNNRDIATAVEGWLNRVEATIAEANELVNKDNEGHGEARCLKRPFPNLCFRRRLSKGAEKMAKDISTLIDEGRSHQVLYFPVPPQTTTSSHARGYEALESRTSTLNEIKQALKDPHINRIGVYGMGGVGKTTLMKELACQAKTERLFEVVVMVTSITSNPDLRRIQGELADELGPKLEKETQEGRAGELRGRISSKKSILIILDDIWDELNLEELGVPYGADHKGCKLVLTSRDLYVLSRKMNTQKDFSLQVFSEGESWNLFEKIVGDGVKIQNIKSIAVDVVKCCAGLPLLIDIVGKSLRKEQDDRVWNDTLTRLKSKSGDDKVNNILKLSYDRLKREELKSLFLLVGSFGQVGIGVCTEELLQVCWGLDIYKDVCTLAQARNRQHTLIKDLRASSLLLDGENEWVRMHDLVHDVAKSIASDETTRCTYTGERLTKINEWPRNDQLQNYHHIILRDYRIRELPEKLECPKLEVLLLHVIGAKYLKLKIPDNFFSDMGEKVKVLYLSGMKLTNPLPPSLRYLVGLRSLNLTGSVLEDIAIIGELTSLEILILERAKKLVKLPKKIGDLTRLRVLNVNGCQKLRLIPKNLLSSLECLEELYMKNCPIEWEVEGSNNDNNIASLGELRNLHKLTALDLTIKDGSIFPRDLHNFANLERYNISVGMQEWKRHGSNLSRALMLRGSASVTIFSNVGAEVLLTRVEDLYLTELECVNGDGFMKLRHLVFPELRSLFLHGLPSFVSMPLTVDTELAPQALFDEKVAMPNLETMELFAIDICKIWDDNLAAHSCIQNLRTLNISSCGRLTSLFPSSVARALVKLKHLTINRCERLKKIFLPEDISTEEPQVTLPNLETLLISGLHELELLWPSHFAPNSYCKLNKMEVSSCRKLLNVFPSYVLNSLHSLESLDVSLCDELRVIFETPEPSTIATNNQGLPTRLRTLTLNELPKLKHIWSKDPHGILRFQNLCMVDVHHCRSLDYVFPFSAVENLQQLQVLGIHVCGIKNIFEKNDSNEVELFSLEKLTVQLCDGLKNIVPPSVVFQNLSKLRVFGCYGAVNVMSPTTATSLSKLRVLKVSGCERVVEIVASENDGDALSDITFMTLEKLELEHLSELTSFCGGNYSFKFPSLKTLRVSQCPKMLTFCTGNLSAPSLGFLTTSQPFEKPVKDRWDGDLNTTIRNIFAERTERLN